MVQVGMYILTPQIELDTLSNWKITKSLSPTDSLFHVFSYEFCLKE